METKKESVSEFLDRHGLRGPCPVSDADWVMMQAGSVVASAIRSITEREEQRKETEKIPPGPIV